MQHFPIPSTAETHDCLIRLLFGYEGSLLDSAVRLAYSDLSRTIHGIAHADPGGAIRTAAGELLLREILAVSERLDGQAAFDQWHESTSAALSRVYSSAQFSRFYIGHAQKWVNMAVKYCALLDDRAVPSGGRFFSFGHIPIDSLVINALSRSTPSLPAALRFPAWSRIDSYAEYMAFQCWVREAFPSSTPLSVEFFLWQEEATLIAKAT